MRTNYLNALVKAAVSVACILLFGVTAAFGQQQINLTAAPTTTTLPDGTSVPMWGYTCGAVVSGSTAKCAALNPAAALLGQWSPVVITVPTGAAGGLQINLTNNLSFTPTTPAGASANNIPTSIMIVGQVGGGLGTSATYTTSPDHTNAQGCVSWFIAQLPPGVPCAANSSGAFPPQQGPRVQSFGTEVAAAGANLTTGEVASGSALTWANLRPGTYLLESGTHPSIQVPMGLIGMLVVTAAPVPAVPPALATPGTAYPGVAYNAEVPLEFSEIDPVQNKAVDTAVRTVGFSETAVWSGMNGNVVDNFIVTPPGGTGYAAPLTVTITPTAGGGSGAAASASLTFNALTIVNGGSGYTAGDQLTLVGGGYTTPATATVNSVGAGGVITSVTLTNPGTYSAPPTNPVSVTAAPPSNGRGATFNATGFVSGVTVTNGGAGYTTAPQVLVTGAGGTGSGAVVTAFVSAVGCGQTHTCYPPAVNYTPFYYLINGVAFTKTSPQSSLFSATAGVDPVTGLPATVNITGTVLARLVNAGLRMHVPSIVGSQTQGFTGAGVPGTVSGFTLIAEDGNVVPGVVSSGVGTAPAPRVQTDVFMAAGKVFDVMINAPTCATAGCTNPALPLYDRELSLSGNSSTRDAGMLAYISVNNATPSAALPAAPAFTGAVANPDTYNSLGACPNTAASCSAFVVSDVSKGVIANDINVYGVQLLAAPTKGTLTCTSLGTGLCANGTFTYTPNPGTTSDSFTYCANGTVTAGVCSSGITATVTLGAFQGKPGTPTAIAQSYTSPSSTYLKIASPGLLIGNTDPNNLQLSVVPSTTTDAATGNVLVVDAAGGFTLSLPGHTTTPYTFQYTVQNSQGVQSASAGTVTVNFLTPNGPVVNVVDAQAYNNCQGDSTCITNLVNSLAITDYRWIIEEDKTFWIDPNCTTNTGSATRTPGCPALVGPSGQSTIPTFGVNFHTSSMDYVAQGCTGPQSCEAGQTVLDNNPTSATYGQHIPAVCDVGNGACRPDTTGNGSSPSFPTSVHLDPTKRYYISVLPGDAANPFAAGSTSAPGCLPNGAQPTDPNANPCGHTMGGAPIPAACNVLVSGCNSTSTAAFAPVTVLSLPTPLPTGKLSVIVFEDDFPLNGEQDASGGVDVLSPNEPGLGGFNLVLWDTYGGLGDVTGQDTYDAFNQPLSNSLAGTIDPSTGLDACPISPNSRTVTTGAGANQTTSPSDLGIAGMIVTCPKYESDGQTLSPLAGQAVIANLMPDKFSVQAYPGADRIARGEEWLQTNTLDGQHPHDSFIRIGEPSYFQEYGPAGFHVAIGFANPKIINDRHDAVCAGAFGSVGPCTNTIKGQVDVQRLSRTPDQRLYPSGSRDALAWTQCWVSLGDPDAEDFMFTKCDAQGNFTFNNVPSGNWRLTIGDQWNDQIIDGLSTPANVGCATYNPVANTGCTGGQTLDLKNIGVQQWQSNLYTKTCVDDNRNGICDSNEIGIPLIYTRVRYRDGHNSNSLTTDFNGVASFNETFPLFNWYVVESDPTRYKTTGIHTVYDAGGPADGDKNNCGVGGARPCGTSTAYNFLANTYEAVPLPGDLSVPGAVYCATADCDPTSAAPNASTFAAGTPAPSCGGASPCTTAASTGRIDPPWVYSEAWSGLTSQGNWIEFAKAPYASCPPSCVTVPIAVSNPNGGTTASTTQAGENGGIEGVVEYAATRPFDSAEQMIQQPWEPFIPRVTVNLYQEGFAADGVTPTLTLVDTTKTTSWDDWAQGFYPNSTTSTGGPKPYMSCPGQGTASGANADLFYYTLFDQPNYLDWYNNVLHGTALNPTPLPYNSQFKCYDAMHIWNQVQPAPYDGHYSFPSMLGVDQKTGKWASTTTNNVTTYATNCTICVGNPDSSDPWRFGTPMLPPGKYVVQVIMPPGYEVYKEEDKNLLIGDNFIAPVTVQFPGAGGSVFILPDQASVASLYDPNNTGYNPTNFQNQTTGLNLQGDMLSGVPGYPGFTDPIWPCVGEMRVVPDFLSLFPQAVETAPFAGATRPLCDRKEVTLTNQVAVNVKFALFTSTHIASKFTGVITDDFTSEFDPFAPQFGEKFAPPNLPISTRDYLGNEVSRVYSDHFGIYDGLTFSSWEVNPPNITGYSPSMMIQCMNDPGPIPDPNHPGQFINDPLYNPAYSNFCYEEPYMPGLTAYLDTPVVPTQAFVGAGYNNPDCAYPDATPAISEVDGDQIGPWVSDAGHALKITALGNTLLADPNACVAAASVGSALSAPGDVTVTNAGYSGPSASVAPFNCKTVSRHYGFGSRCTSPTAASATCNTQSSVTIGGVRANITSWSDTSITATVNLSGNGANVPQCAIQQQAQYGGPAAAALCGQLVITAGNGKRSIDAVTVTIGGKAPVTHVAANQSIQSAIDAAQPGDLIIVDPTCTTNTGGVISKVGCAIGAAGAGQSHSPAAHTEMLIMWKPVRLQGVGAASTIINANTHPAGKLLDPWRRHINCLFGLTLQGTPAANAAAYDPSGQFSCPDGNWTGFMGYAGRGPQVDRLPSEGLIGWDATLNGNLAEQLQEPSLMGAYEGAGITVIARGVDYHGAEPFNTGGEAAFPTGTTLLTGVVAHPETVNGNGLHTGDSNQLCKDGPNNTNRFPSAFICNPSSIDGLTITNSSQGGGGIFVHGWAHLLQISNNRVYNNAGTLSGGISVGQGEFGPPYLAPTTNIANLPPGSCSDGTGFVDNQHMPWCLQMHVDLHNNMITHNSSIGDELFSATLSGGGGATFCTGNDYYKFGFNWVCGNLSAGEGGGMVHLGEIFNGDIEFNQFVFNQSSNPTIPTNGGGIMVQGTPDTDPTCPGVPDTDCPSGLSDGTGPGLTINANLIQGNSADSGSGGGIRLQQVNGTEVNTFASQPQYWNNVNITNNMIVNNVAGWDGAGISLQDALKVNIVNNTIAHNDSLATSGVLTFGLGAPAASAPGGECHNGSGSTSSSCPQSAGVTSTPNSALLTSSFAGLRLICPAGHEGCQGFSNPVLFNDLIWQNRSFFAGITGPGQGNQNQQNLVGLFNAISNAPVATQSSTPATTANGSGLIITGGSGACVAGTTYWEVGVRGDTGPGNHSSGFTLSPAYSVLTDAGDYPGFRNSTSDPTVVSEYCNGSRVPPECTVADGCGGPHGFGVPPGISDAVTPNPLFTFAPSATVDEGNNWINVSWGPLSLSNPSVKGADGNYGGGSALGNYALAANSPAINFIPTNEALPDGVHFPTTDFFGNRRPDAANGNCFDVGAVEFVGGGGGSCGGASLPPSSPTLTSISPNRGLRGAIVNVTLTGNNLTSAQSVNAGNGITVNIAAASQTTVTATFTISSGASLGAHNVTVTTLGGTSSAVTFTVTGATVTISAPSPALTTAVADTTVKNGTITVRNASGATGALILTAAPTVVQTAGSAASTFAITGGSCAPTPFPAAGVVVNPGGSCTINVQYTPADTTTSTAHVSLANSGAATNPLLGQNFNAN